MAFFDRREKALDLYSEMTGWSPELQPTVYKGGWRCVLRVSLSGCFA